MVGEHSSESKSSSLCSSVIDGNAPDIFTSNLVTPNQIEKVETPQEERLSKRNTMVSKRNDRFSITSKSLLSKQQTFMTGQAIPGKITRTLINRVKALHDFIDKNQKNDMDEKDERSSDYRSSSESEEKNLNYYIQDYVQKLKESR